MFSFGTYSFSIKIKGDKGNKEIYCIIVREKTCPSKKFTLKAIEKSRKNAPTPLAKRFWHTIVKKMSLIF